MKNNLAENIRTFRKARGLTQEQFAEVFNVTFGAVHKWEAGLSTPELPLLLDMADFFDTSLDVLVGFDVRDNRVETLVDRLKKMVESMDPEGPSEAEKALKKYPHSFAVVRMCANLYRAYGSMFRIDLKYNLRAKELYKEAIKLISQNNDPNINETELYGELAGVYHAMGDISKSLEIYKAHNAGGIFNTPIGLIMITNGMDLEEADRYLSYGFIDRVGKGINLFLAKALYYYRTGQLDEAKVLFEMVLSENNYMRKNDAPSFLDRLDCVYLTGLAFIELNQKNKNEALRILKDVKSKAEAFDAAPDYDLTNLRFVSRQERLSAYDTLGSTCKEIVENSISELRSPELMKLWKSINKRGTGK